MGWTSQFDGEVSVTFPHPVERVWPVISDLARIGEWSPECRGVVWLDGASGPGPGARFVGRNRWGPVRWRTTCTVVRWEPGRALAYDARHVTGACTRWTFELTPDGAGAVVTQRFATQDSPAFMMVADRLARRPSRLRVAMSRTLRAMRDSMG